MSNDSSAAPKIAPDKPTDVSAEQVINYLRTHTDFFITNDELLTDLNLPHESGKAISLLERQVALLRTRGTDARSKLNRLLDNARNNDQLFETTRDLVLALLRARDLNEIVTVTQDKLSQLDNIEACEIILVQSPGLKIANNVRTETSAKLKKDYADVFRLKRTHCGSLNSNSIAYLFPAGKLVIKSTALCPIVHNGDILAMLALGNQQDNYFNINLDTLFLDFIGNVIGAVMGREIDSST